MTWPACKVIDNKNLMNSYLSVSKYMVHQLFRFNVNLLSVICADLMVYGL